MFRIRLSHFIAAAVICCSASSSFALTREIADLQRARLTFDRSVLNQLSYDTYRDPFDELQSRPYNLLFQNIGRYSNLSPWQGQEGNYTNYLNALIGNNGVANIDNNADAMQGAWIRRHSSAWAYGGSIAFLAGNNDSSDLTSTVGFGDSDDLSGYDFRGAAARQLGESRVLGFGLRMTQVSAEETDGAFETGVGGFRSADRFEHSDFTVDTGLRTFISENTSWDVALEVGAGSADRDLWSENLDGVSMVTDRFVITDYDISDLIVKVSTGYNRQAADRLGETEYRVTLMHTSRELDNTALSYGEALGVITPSLTLLDQDALTSTRVSLSAKKIFQAGETEMFGTTRFMYGMTDGATSVDAASIIVNEAIDDTQMSLGLTIGLRQPLYRDKLRVIVAGHAEFTSLEESTVFDSGLDTNTYDQTSTQYAVGLEGVLANVVFDLAWLFGEEDPVLPVGLGLPPGSRRSIEVDRLVFSAAVAW